MWYSHPLLRGRKRGGRNKQRSGGMTLDERCVQRERERNIGHLNENSFDREFRMAVLS
jgi:hypothetical protein